MGNSPLWFLGGEGQRSLPIVFLETLISQMQLKKPPGRASQRLQLLTATIPMRISIVLVNMLFFRIFFSVAVFARQKLSRIRRQSRNRINRRTPFSSISPRKSGSATAGARKLHPESYDSPPGLVRNFRRHNQFSTLRHFAWGSRGVQIQVLPGTQKFFPATDQAHPNQILDLFSLDNNEVFDSRFFASSHSGNETQAIHRT